MDSGLLSSNPGGGPNLSAGLSKAAEMLSPENLAERRRTYQREF